MSVYGEPKTFTLDYGQMNQLFELLETALNSPTKDDKLEGLRALRNELYRHLD
jgi:hypothetical protein